MNKNNRIKTGFTIIEVLLFLAISGAITAGIIAVTSNSLSRQRYNNAVQEYADFLSSLYSSVTYVQNPNQNAGRSDKVIYGKLLVFDANNLSGQNYRAYTYDVIGNTPSQSSTTADPLEILKNTGTLSLLNQTEQKPNSPTFIKSTAEDNPPYRGSILIFRSPNSGTIYTYSSDKYDFDISNFKLFTDGPTPQPLFNSTNDIDFCIDSEDRTAANGGSMQDIRIVQPAYNSAAITFIEVDSEENRCLES